MAGNLQDGRASWSHDLGKKNIVLSSKTLSTIGDEPYSFYSCHDHRVGSTVAWGDQFSVEGSFGLSWHIFPDADIILDAFGIHLGYFLMSLGHHCSPLGAPLALFSSLSCPIHSRCAWRRHSSVVIAIGDSTVAPPPLIYEAGCEASGPGGL